MWRPRLLLALLLLFAASASFGDVAHLKWMTGFPQRIGEQVMLMWDPAPGAVRYTITRTTPGKEGAVVLNSVTNTTIDQAAPASDTLIYTVTAMDDKGGVLSETSPAALKGVAPLMIPKWTGQTQDGPRVLLSWQGDGRTVFYSLYRQSGDQKPVFVASLNVPRYVDDNIEPDKTYKYTVRATGQSGGESKDSDPLIVKVAPWAAQAADTIQKRLVEVSKFQLANEVKIAEPTEIVYRNNLLYISDLGSRSIMALSLDGKLVTRFAQKPKDYPGEWGIPWGLSADVYGRRWAVTFLQSPNIRVFDETGTMVLDFPVQPPPDLSPAKYLPSKPQPMDVAIEDQEGFWITEYVYGQVVYFDVRGKEAGRVGNHRVSKDFGPFKNPTFILVHPGSGYVNVVDSLQAKIFRLFNDGKVAGTWGGSTDGDGVLQLPKGIDVNGEGELLIIDGMLSTLQAFTQGGKLTAVYSSKYPEEQPIPRGMVALTVNKENGDIYVTSKIENAIYRLRPVKN